MKEFKWKYREGSLRPFEEFKTNGCQYRLNFKLRICPMQWYLRNLGKNKKRFE